MEEKNLFISVTEDYHQKVKEHCVKKKITIQNFVTNLITKELFKKARKIKSPAQG